MKNLALILFLIVSNRMLSQNTWSTTASLPVALWGATSFSINNEGYVLGGYQSNGVFTNNIWKYDAINNQWMQLSTSYPGCGRYKLASFVINNILYVGLGSQDFQNPLCSDFWMFDPLSLQWSLIPSLPTSDSARTGATGITINGKGYVFGGHTYGNLYYNDFYEYDPTNNLWTAKASLPNTGRTYCASFSNLTNGYILGGQNGDLENNPIAIQELWQYNPTSDTWAQLSSYPGIGLTHSAVTINNCHLVGLGAWTNEFWSYDTQTNTWTQLQPFPSQTGSYLGVSFTIGNIAYFGSGLISQSTFSSTMYSYNPLQSCSVITGIIEENKSIMSQNGSSIIVNVISSNKEFNLYDITGRLIKSQNLNMGTNIINLESYSGVFIISIKHSDKYTEKRKIVLMRE